MIHTLHDSLRLVSRSEGKIKSYQSSADIRSWSHDASRRARYLRDWMKSDTPVCIISVQSLAAFLNTMTCRSRRKVAPKCHPDCKSKLVLDSICNTCLAMQECLRKDSNMSAYFQEQEFETSFWPCERCLEVLKNIKMFWNIVVEKVLSIKIPKTGDFKKSSQNCHQTDTVHSVAKLWEKELIDQTMFVNKIVPILKRKCETTSEIVTLHKSSPCCKKFDEGKKTTRCTSINIKMVDVETSTEDVNNDEVQDQYKVEYLQKQFNSQEHEMANLKRENNSLKLELEHFYENYSWKVPFYLPIKLTKTNNIDAATNLSKPIESCTDDSKNCNLSKGIDSEMIITMKDCKNDNYKHVSLLQVLHKTNEPIDILSNIRKPSYIKENPIELLTKVQNTFGELVRREIDVVNQLKDTAKESEVTASFSKIAMTKSEPSCTTLDFQSKKNTSSSNFYSM